MKHILIAIDGYSACGKTSSAKLVAEKLNYNYVDTGAMYRAITLHFLKNNINLKNKEETIEELKKCDLAVQNNRIFLNDRDVSDEIRTQKTNENVSLVSAIPEVRKKLVRYQRLLGRQKKIVIDGRDIGTVVFPDAELKIFMIADINIRTKRRKKELLKKEIHLSSQAIYGNLLKRDEIDARRSDSPLKKAVDAIEIDTSFLTLEEQVEKIVLLAKKKIYGN